MKRLMIAALVALAGCAQTPLEVRENPPIALTSVLPPEKAATCIERNFEQLNPDFTTHRRPLDAGGIEITGRVQSPLFIAEVRPSGSGAAVRLWRAQNWYLAPDLMKGC